MISFSDSPATVSNTVKVMPASIKGTIVQNVCSASPAEIGATTLLVTTSTPAVSFSEIPVFTQDDGTDKNASGTEQCTIEVKSIPRVIAVEVLEMYFENSRSGGSKDCVKEIKIIDSETAHVIFHTPEGLFIRLFLLYVHICVQLLPASWQKKVTPCSSNLWSCNM